MEIHSILQRQIRTETGCGVHYLISRTLELEFGGAMKKVAAFDVIITAGVVAATLSSAMASFLGAPRILQSLAEDRIFPFLLPFAKVEGTTEQFNRAGCS
jgi:amino acid transporter